jgi:hypothetical protein
MGTRSLTVFLNEEGQEICVMYRQFDGHPDSHGQELANFLKHKELVNGYSMDKQATCFNGMPCVAAQVIGHFKRNEKTGLPDAGGFYLYPPGTRDAGEEYLYTVYQITPPQDFEGGGVIGLKVQAGAMTMFGLPGTKQKNMPLLYDGPVGKYDGTKANEVLKNLANPIPNDFLEGTVKKKLNTQKKRIKAFVASNPRVKVKH